MYHCARGGRLQSWLDSVLWWLLPKECHKSHPLYPPTPPSSLYSPLATLSLTPLAAGGALIYPTWFCFLASEGRKHSLSPANLPSTLLFPNLFFSTFYLFFFNCSLLPAAGKGMFSPEVWMGGVSFPVRLLCKLSLPLTAGRDCLLSSSLPPSEQITKRSMFYSDNGANVEKNCW